MRWLQREGEGELTWHVPRNFYGEWYELELIELGQRAARCYDEGSSLEHRFAKAGGPAYGSPPAHWVWDDFWRELQREETSCSGSPPPSSRPF